jgi:hypothetical protein
MSAETLMLGQLAAAENPNFLAVSWSDSNIDLWKPACKERVPLSLNK